MATSEAKARETLTQRSSNQASIEPSLSILESAAETRVAIEGVWPEIDGGRFPVKRAVGDVLTVEADIFCDGHDKIDAALIYRRRTRRTIGTKTRCGSSSTTAGGARSRSSSEMPLPLHDRCMARSLMRPGATRSAKKRCRSGDRAGAGGGYPPCGEDDRGGRRDTQADSAPFKSLPKALRRPRTTPRGSSS